MWKTRQKHLTKIKTFHSTTDFEYELEDLTASLTKDVIVCGIAEHTLRDHLLRDGQLTLEKATAGGHAAEKKKTSRQGAQRI